MLKKIISLINGQPTPVPTAPIDRTVIENVRRELRKIPRYPPFDEGMPLVDIDEIVESQSELIEKLKTVCGFTPEGFEQRMMSVIRNYAKFVHLLPATKDEHHKGAGGLFRLGLEVGFASMQSASGKMFGGRESAEKRKVLQPRWIYATFIAGLCCELHRPITSMTINDPEGNPWQQFLGSLFDWGMENGVDRYFIKWTDAKSAQQAYSISAFHFDKIIPKDCQQYLNEDSAAILSAMTACITGAARHGDGNLIAEIVKNARAVMIEKDVKANPTMYGQLQLGSHIEPIVADAMRELVNKGDWKVNTKQARVWYTSEGMFVIWQPAYNDIMNVIKGRNLKGFPNSADTMAEMLLHSDRSMLEMNRFGGPYWEVMLPGSGKLVSAVKLSNPNILMDREELHMSDLRLMLPNSEIEVSEDVEDTPEAPKQESQGVDAPKRQLPKDEGEDQNTKSESSKEETPPQTIPAAKSRKAEQPAIDPDFYLNQVGEDTRMLLGAIRRDYLAKESEHPIWMSAKGLVISTKEFNSHGIAPIKVIEDMRARNWFVVEANSSRLLIKAERDGVKVDAYLINRQIAEAIGFKEPENA